MENQQRDFIIRRDSEPVKVLRFKPQRVNIYMHRVQTRFPKFSWSISDRFPLCGSD